MMRLEYNKGSNQLIGKDLLQFTLQILPVIGYLIFYFFRKKELSEIFYNSFTKKETLISLAILLPWFTQIAVINTCHNNSFPGKSDSLQEDILGILRSLVFFVFPFLFILLTLCHLKLDWPINYTLYFSSFLIAHIIMCISMVILTINKKWGLWSLASLLYLILLYRFTDYLFIAPVVTFIFCFLAFRSSRILKFQLNLESDVSVGLLGLSLGTLVWFDKILFWLDKSTLISSGSIFFLLIPGLIITNAYFSFFSFKIHREIEELYLQSTEKTVSEYLERINTTKNYFLDLSVSFISLGIFLLFSSIALCHFLKITMDFYYITLLATIIIQSLSFILVLILNIVNGKEIIFKWVGLYALFTAINFLIFPNFQIPYFQFFISTLTLGILWFHTNKQFLNPIERSFISNIQNGR